MAANFLVTVDHEELGQNLPDAGQMIFFNDPSRTERYIRDLSARWPNSTICFYRLNQLQKLKTNPTYARYKVDPESGEILPL